VMLMFWDGWSMYAAASASRWSSRKLKATVTRDRRASDMDNSMSEMLAWKGMELIAVFEL